MSQKKKNDLKKTGTVYNKVIPRNKKLIDDIHQMVDRKSVV